MRLLATARGVGRRRTNSSDDALSLDADDSATGSKTTDPVDPTSAAASPSPSSTGAQDDGARTATQRGGARWRSALGYAVLPAIALILAVGAGYLKWYETTTSASSVAAGENAVKSASESTVAMLSYKADSVEAELTAAANRLTGGFKDSYTSLVHDIVIPGAKQRKISSVATVQAAAAESTSATHAVVLLFVNQSVSVGADAPSDTASSVRVTLDKVDGRWLVSGFDPV